MNIPKYKPLNAFYSVVDNNNNLYYVSMNYKDADGMREFYETLAENTGLSFKTMQIHKNSQLKIDGSENPRKINFKIDSRLVKNGSYEQRLL